ncbi:MAG: NAD-dependent epimerase/dehydratase family protein, partial [Gallionellaceae bacterium]
MDSRTESLPSEVNRAKTVVIVGASGYIGRHLIAELRRLGGYRIKLLSRSLGQDLSGAGSAVEVFKGDLRAPETLRGLFESDCTVINLAYLWEAGEAANLEVTANLLEACKSAKIKRLIHCSTAAVVGRTSVNRITEDTVCRPATEYGITKLKVEQAIIK